MSAAEALEEHLRDGLDVATDESWSIQANADQLGAADWCARKAGHLRGRQEEISRAGHAQIETIKAWMARERQLLESEAVFFEHLLVDWHQQRMTVAFEEAGQDWSKVRGKTQRLPSGAAVSARQLPDRVDVDEAVFLPWVLGTDYDALYRTKFEPDKRAVVDHVKETGEAPPGVTFVTGEVTFKVAYGADARKEADQ